MDQQVVKNRFGIIGSSPALVYALDVAIQVANTDLSVLINGESGVWKVSKLNKSFSVTDQIKIIELQHIFIHG